MKATARIFVSEQEAEALLSAHDDRDHIGSGLIRCDAGRGYGWRLKTASSQWLFGMSAVAHYVSAAGLLDVAMEIDLNPTRFMAHQPDPTLTAIRARAPMDALRVDQVRCEELSAATLDGNDNVLIGRDRFPDFVRRDAWWTDVLDAYLGHVRAALSAAFSPPGIQACLDRFDFESVQTAEVYWELDQDAALAWVRGLSDRALCADAKARVTEYVGAVEGEGNAKVFHLEGRNRIDIKVYAKTFGRVRLEISYKVGCGIKQLAMQRTKYILTTVVEILQGLRADASRRLCTFWGGIMQLESVSTEAASLKRLFSAVVRAAQDDQAEHVLEMLFVNHRIEQTGPRGFAPKATCDALERDGVLVRARLRKRPTAPQFALAPPYARLIADKLGSVPASPLH